jgi:hypothetical protein
LPSGRGPLRPNGGSFADNSGGGFQDLLRQIVEHMQTTTVIDNPKSVLNNGSKTVKAS